jgi:hypothetical protein
MAQNYVLLETIELTQSAASVTFDNIPQTGYTDLKVVVSARASASANWALIGINGGSDTATTLRHLLDNEGTPISQTYTSLRMLINGSTLTANTFSSSELYFSDYTSANQKTISGEGTQENNAAGGNRQLAAFLWPFTSAITSLTFTVDGGSSFVAGSTFSIYGIAALGTTPVTAPLATGGNIVANDGTYWYHAFLSSGTFVPQTSLSCDYLVVAGGAGGGVGAGAGGGAGAFRTATSQPLTVTSYTVTIGAGAAARTGSNQQGNDGSNSVFNGLTSVGGGGGGAYAQSSNDGRTGGSGGGASTDGADTGTGGAGQTGGNNGGSTTTNVDLAGAGGGGAGAVGSANSGTVGGGGGIGSSTAISGGAATGMGQLSSGIYYFAGGGGGGVETASRTPGAGGLGGGGAGGTAGVGRQNGTVNTGGGGGGSKNLEGTAGGSGIVIIRYAMV